MHSAGVLGIFCRSSGGLSSEEDGGKTGIYQMHLRHYVIVSKLLRNLDDQTRSDYDEQRGTLCGMAKYYVLRDFSRHDL